MRKLLLFLVLLSGCTKVYNQLPTEPSDNSGSGSGDTIEYRVTGNATTVQIKYANSLDGVTQVTTGLPFSTTFTSYNKKAIFLSLDAQVILFSQGVPFMNAQIYVNGTIFKEASTNSFSVPLSLSATYRH